MTSRVLRAVLLGAAIVAVSPAKATEVRIGQAVPTLAFLSLYAARAVDSFKDQGLELEFASIRGGDPPALAALDSGDIDFAAVGSVTVFEAIAKGQPFQLIYSLMSRATIELVVSNAFLERTGVTPDSPLKQRIAALSGATIGVSAVGGAQDRTARWVVKQGGLDPQRDIKIALIGPPPAIQAALDNNQIDGYLLSPPQGRLTEDANMGKVLIRLGAEFPNLAAEPDLVLVAKTPIDEKRRKLAIGTAAALQQASRGTLENPQQVAAKIQQKFYPKLKPEVVLAAVEAMSTGIADDGRMTQQEVNNALQFTSSTGSAVTDKLGANSESGALWTNEYIDAARQQAKGH